jgi:8-oxo-dGTP pyrophosphatase MutT (NUDIX family)
MLTRENNGEKEVLLALRKNTGYNDGEYELPGGHVEADEDLINAMIREAKEELNIELKREDLKIEHILHHYKGNCMKFIISSEKYDGDLKIGEPDKCEKLEWFNVNNLPENTDKKLMKVLKEIKKGIFYDNSDFINLDKK